MYTLHSSARMQSARTSLQKVLYYYSTIGYCADSSPKNQIKGQSTRDLLRGVRVRARGRPTVEGHPPFIMM